MPPKKTIEQQYKFSRVQDALTQKDWAGGSAIPEESVELIIGGDPVEQIITYAPAWWKIVDEAVVNALDHIMRCIIDDVERVTRINISFDPKDGHVTVYNTGVGIPVAVHADASRELSKETYVVEFVFGMIFQGSNLERDADCIIGGTNGIGIKLVNSFSNRFIVDTYDASRKLRYVQEWTDGMNVCHPPKITEMKSHSYTSVKFWPNYERFKCADPALLEPLVRNRAICAAMYAAHVTSSPPIVEFNGKSMVKFRKPIDIAKILFPGAEVISTQVIPGDTKGPFTHTWEAAIAIADTTHLEHDNLSVINGVIARGGGHINRVRACIVDAVKKKLINHINENDLKKIAVTKHVFIVLCCRIPNPSWEGQRKDTLGFKADRFKHYNIEEKPAAKLAKLLADSVRGVIESTNKPTKKEKISIDYDIYTPSEIKGPKSVNLCGEGASAISTIKEGKLSRKYYSTLSLGGVPMNVRREIEVRQIADASRQYVVESARLKNNKLWQTILFAWGVDVGKKYTSLDGLKCGRVVIIVDQDYDGKGNILGLILSMFAKVWPCLIRLGFVQWFATPIIRAYPTAKNGTIMSFYSTQEYEEWASNNPPKHDARYYKGLGRHTPKEAAHMFEHMADHLYTYVLDRDAEKTFEIYLGDDADKRKVELARPMRVLSIAERKQIDATKKITCTQHLQTDTCQYQKDNVERKLDHEIDGQNQAGRKILHSLLRHIKTTKSIKVSRAAAAIGENEDYHHGEASLENSIFTRGFIAPGGKQLPFVVPYGAFGSRLAGGNDHAAARYGEMLPNKRLLDVLFPDADYHLLKFNVVDGKRYEPKYFVPIIPTVICESTELPAHGWKLTLWARDAAAVMDAVELMIKCDTVVPTAIPPYTYSNAAIPFKGDIRIIEGSEYCFGKYVISSNSVIITELPLRVWTNSYVNSLAKSLESQEGFIGLYNDDTDPSVVNITVQFKPNVIDYIRKTYAKPHWDGIIERFGLRSKLMKHINLMNTEGGVTEYARYDDVFYRWYHERRDLYIMRLSRELEILRLKIRYYSNIVRYIEQEDRMARRKLDEMFEHLEKNKYDKFNKSAIDSPGFTATRDLAYHACVKSASYNYLVDLSDRNKSAESLAKFIAKRDSLQRERDLLQNDASRGQFPGSAIWLRELAELRKVYNEGAATSWTFGEEDGMTFA